MTALTSNRYTKHRDGIVTAHPVKGGVQIFKGSMVCVDSTGYAVPGADAEGYRLVGVALEGVDNTTRESGQRTVRVQCSGCFSFDSRGVLNQPAVGNPAYIVDDHTVDLDSDNHIIAGRIESLDGSTYAWVRIRI